MTGEFVRGPVQKFHDREFDDPDVVKIMSGMSIPSLIVELGSPHTVTKYAPTMGYWSEGDPVPALADHDPAVMQAIGRCSVSRQQRTAGMDMRLLHDPARCGWCEYPARELLAACDWGVHNSAFVVAEFSVWYQNQAERKGSRYQRIIRQSIYANETWAAFWALPTWQREARIKAAQYPEAA